MSSNEKTRYTVLDTEIFRMDSEKKARRSSILKQQKPRNPFSTVDFTEPNPDNTLARAARRVSFASSNTIKPFTADPENVTIWDNTYEEEVNHTDSSKSSCKQTQDEKTTDLLNLTSVYSPTSEFSPPQNVYSEQNISTSKSVSFDRNKKNTNIDYKNVNRNTNTVDSLISVARNTNNKLALEMFIDKTICTQESVEVTHCVGVKTHISNPFINDISLITPFNDTMDLTNNHTLGTTDTMEMAVSINKENVNPIINDISLITPVESILRRKARSKGKSANDNVNQEMLKENVNVHAKNYPEQAQSQYYLDQTIIFNQCDMELTGSLPVMDIKENLNTNSKTIHFLEEDMELTKPLEGKYNEPKHDKSAINFNRSESDMECTCTLPQSVENKKPVEAAWNGNLIQLEQSDMEMTAALPTPCDVIPERSHKDKFDSKRKTIHFDKSEDDMEFTNVLPITNIKETLLPIVNYRVNSNQNVKIVPILADKENINENNIYTKQNTVLLNDTEGNMDLSGSSEYEANIISNTNLQVKTSHINQYDAEMKSPVKYTSSNEGINSHPNRRTIHFDQSQGDMEFTATLPVIDNININIPIQAEQMEINVSLLNSNVIKARDALVSRPSSMTSSSKVTSTSSKIEHIQSIEGENMEFTTPFLGTNAIVANSTDLKRTILYTKSDADMEFTGILSSKNEEINENTIEKTSTSSIMKHTQYFEGEDMEFTTPFLNKNVIIEKSTDHKRATIIYTKSDDDMEFTSTLSSKKEQLNEKDTKVKTSTSSKMKHIQSIQGEGMDKNVIIENSTGSKRATILCTKSNEDMEFKAFLSSKNEEINEKDTVEKTCTSSKMKHIKSIQGEDMKFTTPFLDKNAAIEKNADPERATILYTKSDDDGMEFTATLSTKNEQINEKNTNLIRKTLNFNQSEIDMEFTKNLSMRNKILEEQTDSENNQTTNVPTKINIIRNKSKLGDSENHGRIMANSESIVDPVPEKETNTEFVTSTPSIINNNSSDNKRHSNSENDDDVIKKIKIDNLSLSECDTDDKTGYESNDRKTFLVCKQAEKYPEDNALPIRAIETDVNSDTDKKTYFVCKKSGKFLEDTLSNTENETDIKTNTNQIHSDVDIEQKVSVQPSTKNILYSEPRKIKKIHNFTRMPDFSASLNLQTLEGSLNLNLVPVSTPAVSFRTSLTNMSPCIEDTQQLIHATFSKPESLEMLLLGKEADPTQVHGNGFLNYKKGSVTSDAENLGQSMQETIEESYKGNEKIFTPDQCRKIENRYVAERTLKETSLILENLKKNRDSYGCIEINKENCLLSTDPSKPEKSCYIEDTSFALAPDLDESSLMGNTSNSLTNIDVQLIEKDEFTKNASSCSASDDLNYTLRCQSVLVNIKEYIIRYQVKRGKDDTKSNKQDEIKNQDLMIKGLIKNFRLPKISVVDLEEKHKRDMEDSSSRVCEAIVSEEADKEAPSMAGFLAPKSLHDRICETAERCKKHWKFVKTEDDYYYFITLFGTLGFRVHVHPELGIVYSVETYPNLAALAKPICWYELKLFEQKLKGENLLSVLGANFDILTLLDYVCMTMEEMINSHAEYNNLIRKYGKSHHFRMESDFSVIFEIINIDLILCWKISVKMSLIGLVSKDDVTATFRVGEKVNEEDIKCIAENTPDGPNFIRNFIENVDEYVRRIEKKIKFRRGNRF